ncbi:hypothetical protein FNF28_04334 [Cafeteria roenbergensis]|uniref:PPIase cyclophilin-type domain-containing protein n=1 Tax=Cafeteria roenbergensis TaxID=33653 RepID=A0A5A8DCZ5_CAFRO|nr:hypothetical protein FNF28_04334 [Cafeteria roenbergensis]
MIQGGDPSGTGSGGESCWGGVFPTEADTSRARHDARGKLCMANSGPDTNGSQFFVLFRPAKHLDGKHTVFGSLVGGMDVLRALELVETGDKDKPRRTIAIDGIDIHKDPVRSWWFVLGLPAIVLVLAATIVTAVAVAWVATQRQQVGQRFAVLAASASEVTRATLTRIVDRVDDGVHSIEAFAPGQNETMLFNSVFQTVGGSLTLGNRDACSGVGFYRLLGQEEFGGWESRVSAAYNFSARVLAPYSAHPPAKSWAMVLEATVPPNLDRYRIGDAVSELPGVEDVVSRIRLGRVAALEQQVFAGGRGPLSMVFGAVFANPNATKPGADPPRGQVAVLASHAGESQRVQPELTRRRRALLPTRPASGSSALVGCNLSPSLLTGQWVRDLASTASDLFAIVQDVTSLSPHPCAEVSATVDQDFHGPASGAIAGELFRTCANGTRVSSLGHSDDVVPFVTGDTEAIVQQTEMEAVSCDEPEHVLMATLGGDDGSAEPLAAASGSAAEAAAVATAGLRLRVLDARELAGGGAVSGHADLVSTGPLSRRARGDSASLGSPVAGSAAAGMPRTVSAQASPSFGSGLRLAGSRAGGLSTARPASVSASSPGPSASVAESSGASQDDDQALSVAELLHDLEVVQAAAAACLRVVGDAADVIGVDPQLAHFGYIVSPLRQLTSETVLRARSMASVPIALRWASGTHPVALLDPAKAEVVIANSMIFVLKQAYSEELVVTMSDGLSPLPEAWFQEQPPELGIVAATTAGMPQRGSLRH